MKRRFDQWPARLAGILGLLLGLVRCSESVARPVAALPTVPVPTLASLTTAVPDTKVGAPVPAGTPVATIQAAAQASPTTVTTPTFVLWRDSRGVFALDVPASWHNQAVPEGIGLTSTAFNSIVIFSLSFAWQAKGLSAAETEQLAETMRERLLASYLVKDPQFSGRQVTATEYLLTGTAMLNNEPSAVEVRVLQTAGGTIGLESWVAPLDLWADVQQQYVAPMRASLTIDDAAIQKIR